MKLESVYQILKEKDLKRSSIPEIQYDHSGHCVHIGKISPGCRKCYEPINYANIPLGDKCQCNCDYCGVNKSGMNYDVNFYIEDILRTIHSNYNPGSYSFTGTGETLFYLDKIKEYMKFFNDLEIDTNTKPWYFLYTNGLLANKETLSQLYDIGINEVRFHIGASNFDNQVFKNIELCSKLMFTTVETPSYPLHRENILEMLPRLNDIGVSYLTLGEIELTKHNYKILDSKLPNARIYQLFEMHLYDEGLVYDVMENVIKNKYNYGVLDCSSMTKCIQRNLEKTRGKFLTYEDSSKNQRYCEI